MIVYKLLIVLSPSVSQKSFYYKFKTVPSSLFVALKELLLGSWPLQNLLSDQALNAWMATTNFYSVPLVVDFPH